MTLFEELKNKYPSEQIPLYGTCIIIPIKEFGKDWERQLKDEGFITHVTERNFKSVMAVQHKKTEIYTKVPIPEKPQSDVEPEQETPLKKPTRKEILTKNRLAPRWTPEQEKQLMKRWNELLDQPFIERGRILAPEFPGRSAQSLYIKWYELKKKPEYKPILPAATKPGTTAATTIPTPGITAAAPKAPEYEKMIKEETPPPPEKDQEKTEYRATTLGVIQAFTDIYTTLDKRLTKVEADLEDLKKTLKEHEHSLQTGKATRPI